MAVSYVACKNIKYIVKGLEALYDYIDECFVQTRYNNVSYEFTKITDKAIAKSKTNHFKKEGLEYYPAIPIVRGNVDFYQKTLPWVEVGDMLVTVYPVNEATARKFLKKGYSIYAYYSGAAEYILEKAWNGGSVIEEECPEVKIGYFNHYHAYTKRQGKGEKRSGIIDGVKINIHGFYGFQGVIE